ncbi:hypothetical protein Aco04nite_22620 [Winogradskya consettensis]|uniref:Uncharacterized protein n=1 Tax=Winogradskya consettensis TaxID=113560 RepID=A0A919SEF1_9ACTN|nr:hypothetical protein Aco04nite_22620 [Actinoplanes consettensis]
MLHHPYLNLYRKQVVKQADLVLAMMVYGEWFTLVVHPAAARSPAAAVFPSALAGQRPAGHGHAGRRHLRGHRRPDHFPSLRQRGDVAADQAFSVGIEPEQDRPAPPSPRPPKRRAHS